MTDATNLVERLYCARCNWRAEQGIAMKNECPNCGARLRIECNDGLTFQGVPVWWDKEMGGPEDRGPLHAFGKPSWEAL